MKKERKKETKWYHDETKAASGAWVSHAAVTVETVSSCRRHVVTVTTPTIKFRGILLGRKVPTSQKSWYGDVYICSFAYLPIFFYKNFDANIKLSWGTTEVLSLIFPH